jgi:hypothetical protein
MKEGNIRGIKNGGRQKKGDSWMFWHSVKKKLSPL